MPIALTNIGWKTYMVNASWDIVIVGLIVSLDATSMILDILLNATQAYYWVETKGKTLEVRGQSVPPDLKNF